MLNVNSATKSAYRISTAKNLTVSFPNLNLTLDNDNIVEESFELSETLECQEYLTFTGCYSSQMKITLKHTDSGLKGQYVEVYIKAGTTEIIPLFKGYVDEEVVTDYITSTLEITAYDVLYSLQKRNIASWYVSYWNSAEYTTLGEFRTALFDYLQIDTESAVLLNDSILFTKQYSPIQMKAIDVVKAICQINGVYGIINRTGNFEFRILPVIDEEETYEEIGKYKKVEYQRWSVVGINKVIVRQSEDSEGGTYGEGENVYILQNNMFTLNLGDEILAEIAENLYPNVAGRPYVVYESDIQGLPYVEVGDVLDFKVYDYSNDSYSDKIFYVINRKLKGIQSLTDTVSADGEEYRTVFISNLNTQIQTIREQIETIQGKLKKMTLNYVTFYNEEDVDVADGETKVIASVDFAVSETCQLRLDMEYLLECETTESIVNNIINNDDLRVTLYYEYDSHILDIREPKETYQDGKHIIHTYYVLDVKNTQPHTWKVYMECDGGSVHIDMLQAQNTMLGLGTIKSDYWDGNVKVSDTVDPIPVGMDDVSISQISDVVNVVLIPPIRIELSDTVNVVEVNNTEVSVAQITDELDAELNP